MYDPKGFFKEWDITKPVKVEGDQRITMQVRCVFSLGPMMSNRLSIYDAEINRDPENPKKFHMFFYTVDAPVPDGVVAAQFMKAGTYEQVGDDVFAHECQTMDLKGYFPKSLMNKLQATLTSDNAKATYDIMKAIKKE